jgi:hypothetical protein
MSVVYNQHDVFSLEEVWTMVSRYIGYLQLHNQVPTYYNLDSFVSAFWTKKWGVCPCQAFSAW